MRVRILVATVLLLLVGIGAYQAVSGREGTDAPARWEPSSPRDDAAQTRDGLYALYFHWTQRCETCRSIERTAHQALAEQLGSNGLRWETLNLDAPANTHFVGDFGLVASSLVLVEYRQGRLVRHENLDLIWEKIEDTDELRAYVASRARNFLGEG